MSAALSRAILASPSNHSQLHSQPRHAAHSSSTYVLDIRPSTPPLLDVANPIRALIWQYMDDCSAIRYLSICRSLQRVYHSYPLQRVVSAEHFSQAEYVAGRRSRLRLWLARIAGLLCHRQLPHFGCCDADGRLPRSQPSHPIPRVIVMSGTVRSSLLPFVQHLVAADVADDDSLPIGPHNPLPRCLRTLRLYDSPNLTLKPATLPPRITALTLGGLRRGAQLGVGVLPHSLVSLHLTGEFNTRSPIVAGVLPPNLQRLEVDEWKLPLSALAMPASVIHLRVHMLNSDTIRPGTLPPNLQTLKLEGFFDQPHPISANVLPASLRRLHLMGCYSQPFTYKTFGALQQLEELQLSHHYSHPLHPHVLPSSLRVLRLGTLWEPVMAGALPVCLERLMVRVPVWSDVDVLVPDAARPNKGDLSIEVEVFGMYGDIELA